MSETKNVLRVENVTMQFGGVVAVDDLSMEVNEGEIVALIGPNGAGKTTAFNVITGVYAPTNGQVLFDGKKVVENHPHGKMRRQYKGKHLGDYKSVLEPTPDKLTRMGMARTFQNIRLFAQMSVIQNVLVGYQSKIHYSMVDAILNTPRRRRADRDAIRVAEEALEKCGLLQYRDERADALPYGKQRKLEIARAIVSKPKMLFLDEPAAGLNIHETEELSLFIKELSAMGFDIVLIEHDMRMIMKISDYIYVLNHGELIAEGLPAQIQQNEEVIRAYIGRRAGTQYAVAR